MLKQKLYLYIYSTRSGGLEIAYPRRAVEFISLEHPSPLFSPKSGAPAGSAAAHAKETVRP
jgi:hypothetical protein